MFRLVSTLLIALSVSALIQTHAEADWLHDQKDSFVLGVSCLDGEWLKTERSRAYVDEAKKRGLSCVGLGISNEVDTEGKNRITAKKVGKVLQSVGEDIQSIEVDSLAKGVAKAVWGAVEFCALTACTAW